MFRELLKTFFGEAQDVIALKQALREEFLRLIGDWETFMAKAEEKPLLLKKILEPKNLKALTPQDLEKKKEEVSCWRREEKLVLLHSFQEGEELTKKEIDAVVFSPSGQWQVFSNRFGLSPEGNGDVFKIADLELPQVWDVGQQAKILEFFLTVLRSSKKP